LRGAVVPAAASLAAFLRFHRKKKIPAARSARTARPPTTPPAIAPALEPPFESLSEEPGVVGEGFAGSEESGTAWMETVVAREPSESVGGVGSVSVSVAVVVVAGRKEWGEAY
jgi:hypothetical protein